MSKHLSLSLLLSACTACHPLSPSASAGKEPLSPLTPDSTLFRNRAGRLFMRLPYVQTHEDISQDPPYSFWQEVWSQDQQRLLDLEQVLDVATFRPMLGTGNYWADKRYIYTAPYFDQPGQKPFFILGRRQQVHFLADPDSVYVHGFYYYRGAFVRREYAPRHAPRHFTTQLP
jgi:hypothetical protein